VIRNYIRDEARGFLVLQEGLVHRFGVTFGNWSMLERDRISLYWGNSYCSGQIDDGRAP
jgi:hypothetical protein